MMYRQLTAEAPDELIAHAVLGHVPEFREAVILQAVYSGENLSEGERLLAPLRRFGPPPVDLIRPRSYAETYRAWQAKARMQAHASPGV